MLKVLVDYPSREEERSIIDRMTGEALPPARPVIELERLLHARRVIRRIYVDDKIKEYVLDLVVQLAVRTGTGPATWAISSPLAPPLGQVFI